MSSVLVYTTHFCGYCTRAKILLQQRGVAFEEINLSGDPTAMTDLVSRTRHRTVPQIFIGETFVGGFDELARLDRSGGLSDLLAAEGIPSAT